MSTYHRALKG